MRKIFWSILLTLGLLPILAMGAEESSFLDKFKDPYDDKFDILGNREMASGLLPVVIPFNEPAVGFGAIGALSFFHPQSPCDSLSAGTPPSISFIGGAYTDNETWAVAGGHLGVWHDGHIRYIGALVYASVNLDFYGIGENEDNNGNPIPFNIEGGGTLQQVEFQIADSRFFAGARYDFSTSYGTFNTDEEVDDDGRTQNAGLGLFASYDNRDNIFTPNRGGRLKASLARYSPTLGGDFGYTRFEFRLKQYLRMFDRLTLGLRFEYHEAGHDAPFYALPWVKLRGIAAFRYLGYNVVTSEIEPRWELSKRWSVLAFAGAGRAAVNFDRLQDAERAYNYGAGFRYLIARRLGLGMGLDVARGPEGTTGYLTIGSAW